jgi:putative exosortase-associated protein (TIGR04073 family)
MPSQVKPALLLTAVVAALVGCTSAEQKLGRGFNNLTEPLRLGEVQRGYEQGALFGGANGSTVGTIKGINRTIGRTVVGAVEVLTFPIPSEPYFKPDGKVYPDSYKPGHLGAATVMATDNSLGFESSDVAPLIPGSRFRVID